MSNTDHDMFFSKLSVLTSAYMGGADGPTTNSRSVFDAVSDLASEMADGDYTCMDLADEFAGYRPGSAAIHAGLHHILERKGDLYNTFASNPQLFANAKTTVVNEVRATLVAFISGWKSANEKYGR